VKGDSVKIRRSFLCCSCNCVRNSIIIFVVWSRKKLLYRNWGMEQRIKAQYHRMREAFGFVGKPQTNKSSPSNRSSNMKRNCKEYFLQGYCTWGEKCRDDHGYRSSEPPQKLRVELERAKGNHRIEWELYYGFAVTLMSERVPKNIPFLASEYEELVSFVGCLTDAICIECSPILSGGHVNSSVVEELCIFLLRFVRELFPATMRFLQHTTDANANLPADVMLRMLPTVAVIKSRINAVATRWIELELLRVNKFESILRPQQPSEIGRNSELFDELSRSINQYCFEQSRQRETSIDTQIQLFSDLNDLLTVPLSTHLSPGVMHELQVFGSAANTFGTSMSDIDIAITLYKFVHGTTEGGGGPLLPVKQSVSLTTDRVPALLEFIRFLVDDAAQQSLVSAKFQVVELIGSEARVPILRLLWRSSSAMSFSDGLYVDLCVDNPNVHLNTRLLKEYSNFDPRVRPLVMAIKLWCSRRGVNCPKTGTLTSYAWSLLVIHYLQCGVYPPVLPSLQADRTQVEAFVKQNTAPVGYLFLDFFRYFGCFLDGSPFCMADKWSHKCLAQCPVDNNHYRHFDYYLHVADIKDGCCYMKQCALDNGGITVWDSRAASHVVAMGNHSLEMMTSLVVHIRNLGNDNDSPNYTPPAAVPPAAVPPAAVPPAAVPPAAVPPAAVPPAAISAGALGADINDDVTTASETSSSSSSISAMNAKIPWKPCIQDPYEDVDLGRVVWHLDSMRFLVSELRRVADIVINIIGATSATAPSMAIVASAAEPPTTPVPAAPSGLSLMDKLSKLSVQKQSSEAPESTGGSSSLLARLSILSSQQAGASLVSVGPGSSNKTTNRLTATLFDEITACNPTPVAVPFYCQLCGDESHQTRFCPWSERPNNFRSEGRRLVCARCNQNGHFERLCPFS
jgi:hypothetical protein